MCNGTWIRNSRSVVLGGSSIALRAKLSDLNPLESFRWGFLKNYVIFVQVQFLSRMKNWVDRTMAAVNTETLEELLKTRFRKISCYKGEWWAIWAMHDMI